MGFRTVVGIIGGILMFISGSFIVGLFTNASKSPISDFVSQIPNLLYWYAIFGSVFFVGGLMFGWWLSGYRNPDS